MYAVVYPFTVAVASALLHLIWQGIVVVALVGLALRVIPKSMPGARYWLCFAALVATGILLPATAMFAYRSQKPATSVIGPDRTALYASIPGSQQNAQGESPMPADMLSSAEDNPGRHRPTFAARLALRWQVVRADVAPWLVAAWLAGVAACALRLMLGWKRLSHIRRSATKIVNQTVNQIGARLAAELHVGSAVRFMQSALIEVPAVVGWLRPVVLLPVSALAGLPTSQLEALIAHELAHVRRQDFLINLVQAVVESLLFYHPAVWWLSSQIRQEREVCCDQLAAAHSGNRRLYVEALLSMEELRAAPRLSVAANSGSLARRAARLLQTEPRGELRSSWWPLEVIVLALTMPLVFGIGFAMACEAEPTDEPSVIAGQVEPVPAPQPQVALSPTEKYLVGRWIGGFIAPEALVLRDDRTFEQIDIAGEGQFSGTWRVVGDKLERAFNNPPKRLDRSLETTLILSLASDDQLKLRSPETHVSEAADPSATYVRLRAGESLPSESKAKAIALSEKAKMLPGMWSDGSMANVVETFFTDGSYVLTSNFGWSGYGTWALEENQLRLRFRASSPDSAAAATQGKQMAEIAESRPIVELTADKVRYQVGRDIKAPLSSRGIVEFRKRAKLQAPSLDESRADASTEPKASERKSVRQIFRPSTDKSGETSWTSLGPRHSTGDKNELMAMITAHRGDRWPVTFQGAKDPWFHVEMTGGNDDRVKLLLLEQHWAIGANRDQDKPERIIKRQLVLERDKSQTITMRGKDFTFCYCSSHVEGREPPVVDHAQIIVGHKLQADAGKDVILERPNE